MREAISTWLDGEEHPLSVAAVRTHLSDCAPCTRFETSAATVTRRARVAAAEPVPDLTASVLVALAADREGATDRRTMELRMLVALAGAVQLVLAIPALLGLIGADLHVGRDLGALQLALGVGLMLAAWQPQRSGGVLPIAAAVALGVLITAGIDVATGAASLTGELAHLSELAGLGALWALQRRVPDQPRLLSAPAR